MRSIRGMLSPYCRSRAGAVALGRFLLGSVAVAVTVVGPRASGQEGAQTERAVDAILLLDSSASMRERDPGATRLQAARFILDYLAAMGELFEVNNRAGFANFGGRVGTTSPLRLVQNGSLKPTFVEEVIPQTDFRPALRYALRELNSSSHGTDRAQVVVLLTDGEPDLVGGEALREKALRDYFVGASTRPGEELSSVAALVREFSAEGAELFVVALGEGLAGAKYWRQLAGEANYLELERIEELASVFHKILSRVMGFSGIREYGLDSGGRVAIPVAPFTAQLTLSVIKTQRQAEVSILDPAGRPARRVAGGGPGDHHEVLIGRNPDWSRPWTASVSGGSATLLVAERPVRLEVEGLGGPYAPGDHARAVFRLPSSVPEETARGVSLTAVVRDPSRSTAKRIPLDRRADGAYELALGPFREAGSLSVAVEAKATGTTAFQLGQDFEIRVLELPELAWLNIGVAEDGQRTLSTTVRSSDALPSGSTVELSVTPSGVRGWTIAQLRDDGSAPDLAAADGVYSGSIKVDELPDGAACRLRLAATTLHGVRLDERSTLPCGLLAGDVMSVELAAAAASAAGGRPPASGQWPTVSALTLPVAFLAGFALLLACSSRLRAELRLRGRAWAMQRQFSKPPKAGPKLDPRPSWNKVKGLRQAVEACGKKEPRSPLFRLIHSASSGPSSMWHDFVEGLMPVTATTDGYYAYLVSGEIRDRIVMNVVEEPVDRAPEDREFDVELFYGLLEKGYI